MSAPVALAHGRPVSLEEAGRRWAVGAAKVSVAIAVTAVVAGVVLPEQARQHSLLVLGVGAALGLPHGAVDHLVPAWRRWVRQGVVVSSAVVAGYAALAVLAYVALRQTGSAGLLAILVLSVLHFGLGDVLTEPTFRAQVSAARVVELVCRTLGRGGSVVVVPLTVWKPETTRLLSDVAGSPVAVPDPLRWVLAGALIGCLAVSSVLAIGTGRYRSGIEDLLLPALFVSLPPLAAFGVYFGGWHALRHTARMVVEQPSNRNDLRRRRVAAPVLRFLGAAVLPTLVAAAAAVALGASVVGGTTAVGQGFTVLLALTVPHMVIVTALDAQRLRSGRQPPRSNSP